jgi:sigma-B regulation protein RsbU (phosphoserine phosphatase)
MEVANTASRSVAPPLRLERVSGPEIDALVISPKADDPTATQTVGRSNQCDIVLEDPEGVLSRRHAEIFFRGGAWLVTDLTSKHGTWINGNRLAPGTPAAVSPGDRLRIGAWVFRVVIGNSSPTSVGQMAVPTMGAARVFATQDDRAQGQAFIKKLASDAAPDSQRRLELLIECAQTIQNAKSEIEIAEAALSAVASGAGFPRSAILRTEADGEQVEVVAQRLPPGAANSAFSRSLLIAAAEGQTVVLHGGDVPNYGQSIVSLQISTAVCAPICVDGRADAFLYVDARGREGQMSVGQVPQDLAAYIQAVARLAGMGLANQHRLRLERDDSRRRQELEAARGVQRIIMPPSAGKIGRLCYHMVSIPGRFVAGDLFDVVHIDDDRVAVLLGDVVGKGIAAGMVMANVQAHLSRLLRVQEDPAVALKEVNQLVAEYGRRAGDEANGTLFLSLWAGIFDMRQGIVRYCDAGHGIWIYRPAGQPPQAATGGDNLPLGVDETAEFQTAMLPINPGDRIMVFSDGVIEQRGAAGEQFGIRRSMESLVPERSCKEDAENLLMNLRVFASASGAPLSAAAMDSGEGFSDDVTIAAIGVE